MPQLSKSDWSEYPSLTVVIPTHNESKSVLKKLENTWAAEYPIPFEVIVVDNSDDDTRKIVRKFSEKINPGNRLKTIHPPDNFGKAHALNIALSQAQGEVFVTTDVNALIDKTGLKEIVHALRRDSTIGCVSGARTVPEPKNVYERGESIYWTLDTYLRGLQSKYSNIRTSVGELSAYRTEVLKRVGGFPAEALSEDFEMTLLLAAHGYKVSLCKEARVSEPAPSTLADLYERKARITYGLLKGLYTNRTLLRRVDIGFAIIVILSIILPCVAAILFPLALYLSLARIKTFVFLSMLGLAALILLLIFRRNRLKNAAIFCLYVLIVLVAILGGISRVILKRQPIPWKRLESTRR